MDDMADAIVSEIGLLSSDAFFPPSLKIDTIYFGGGTPSLLETTQLQRILQTLNSHYFVAADAEIIN